MNRTDLLIFDLGAVLYELDYLLSSNALKMLSLTPDLIDKLPLQEFIDIPSNFEKGLISATEFRHAVKSNYNLRCSDDEFDIAWNKMLIKLKPDALDFINFLKQSSRYKLAILSNTNIIHFNYFEKECKELFNLFDNIFLSFQIGLRKPDLNCYEFVCKEMNIKKENSLFIDDSILNIKMAKKAGLKTFHFDNDNILSDILHTI